MASYIRELCLLNFRPTASVTKRVNSFETSAPGSHYAAPPLENGVLVVEAILLLVTLFQIRLAAPSTFQARSRHFIPGVVVITTLTFSAITYALGIVSLVVEYTVDESGTQRASPQAWLRLTVPAVLFGLWMDPLIFMAVTLILRDRYLAFKSARPQIPALPLFSLMVTSGVFATLMVIVSLIYEVFWAQMYNGYTSPRMHGAFSAILALLKRSTTIDYTYVTIYILATVFLLGFTLVVSKLLVADRIITLILYTTIPLCLRALAQVILVIVEVRLPLSGSYTSTDVHALNLSTILIQGVLYLIVTGILIFCLRQPRLWVDPEDHLPLQDTRNCT